MKNTKAAAATVKGAKESATTETVIKTAVDRALKKDKVSNSHSLRIDAQAKGIALMTGGTYVASAINGDLIKLCAEIDRKALKVSKESHVTIATGNKGLLARKAMLATSGDHSFALFSDGSIIALGTFGDLTMADAGTEIAFLRAVSNGEYFAKGHKIQRTDGKQKGAEFAGIGIGKKDWQSSNGYHSLLWRTAANKLDLLDCENKVNIHNVERGVLAATVGEASAAEFKKVITLAKK